MPYNPQTGQNESNSDLWGTAGGVGIAGGLGYWGWKRYPRQTAQMDLFPRGEMPERGMFEAMGRDVGRAYTYARRGISDLHRGIRRGLEKQPEQLLLPFNPQILPNRGSWSTRIAAGVRTKIGKFPIWFDTRVRTGALWGVPDILAGKARVGLGRIGRGAKIGWEYGFGQGMVGWGLGLAAGAFAAAMAPKGRKVSTFAGSTMGWMLGTFVGGLVGGPIGATVGMFVGAESFETLISGPIQYWHDFARHVRHVGMGGDYIDTMPAYTMRQRAALEMSRSLANARQYLGREAAFLHQ